MIPIATSSTPLLLLAASISFALGITLPLIEVDRLYFFSQQPSLIEVTAKLWSNGDAAIAVLTGLFSIAFPIAKLAVLHVAAFQHPEAAMEVPRWLKALSKWSMLDVLLVALLIFAAKTRGLASAATKSGLWFFALSVILTAIVSGILSRQSKPR